MCLGCWAGVYISSLHSADEPQEGRNSCPLLRSYFIGSSAPCWCLETFFMQYQPCSLLFIPKMYESNGIKKSEKKHLRDTKPHLDLSYSRTELLAILNARIMHGPRFSFFVENQSRRVEVHVSRCRQTAYSSFIKEEIPFLTAPSL